MIVIIADVSGVALQGCLDGLRHFKFPKTTVSPHYTVLRSMCNNLLVGQIPLES